MEDILFWLYLVNAVILIVHEIDSAYWKEWQMLRLPGGVNTFLLLHIPLLVLVLYGLVLIDRSAPAGYPLSLALGLAGILAFSIHTYFSRRGRVEFQMPISQAILWSTLLLSLAQLAVTLVTLLTGGEPVAGG
jgi:hypothetical protein